MISWLLYCLLLHDTLFIACAKKSKKGADQWSEEIDEKGRKSQKLELQAPAITEDEQYGVNLPEVHQCNGCRAVMHHLQASLAAIPTPKRLKSWQYVDAFDKTCSDAMENYGISNVKGVNTLTGPGIEAKSEGGANIQMGGDRWKTYMSSFCKLIVSQVGEEELYELYLNAKLNKDLCDGPDLTFCKEKTVKKKEAKKKKKADTQTNTVVTKKNFAQFLRDQEIADGVKDGEYSLPRSSEEWLQLIKALAGGRPEL